MPDLNDLKQRFYQAQGAKENIEGRVKVTDLSLKLDNERLIGIEEAQAIIQLTAKQTQEKLKYHIEDIVNTALDACFPGVYDFIINFEIKRGKTEAVLLVNKEGTLMDPLEDTGGGLCDVISFALRLSAWTLNRTDNLMVFDEPFKFLSSNLKPLAGDILKKLSQKLGLQMIIVTHDETIVDVADRVFDVSIKKGKSVVEIKNPVNQ